MLLNLERKIPKDLEISIFTILTESGPFLDLCGRTSRHAYRSDRMGRGQTLLNPSQGHRGSTRKRLVGVWRGDNHVQNISENAPNLTKSRTLQKLYVVEGER